MLNPWGAKTRKKEAPLKTHSFSTPLSHPTPPKERSHCLAATEAEIKMLSRCYPRLLAWLGEHANYMQITCKSRACPWVPGTLPRLLPVAHPIQAPGCQLEGLGLS